MTTLKIVSTPMMTQAYIDGIELNRKEVVYATVKEVLWIVVDQLGWKADYLSSKADDDTNIIYYTLTGNGVLPKAKKVYVPSEEEPF